jgi:diguanylate cyclase (GGDEF)-like protein
VNVRLWRAYMLGGVLAIAGYLFVPDGVPRDVAYIAVGLSCVVALLVGIRVNRPVNPRAWYLMAAGQLSWVAGDAIYSWYADVRGVVPFPSIADALYLVAYPLLAAGFALFVRARQRSRDFGAVIDSVIVTLGLGLLSWLFVAGPLLDGSESISTQLISLAYPAADILLLGLLVRLIATPGARTPTFRLLTSAAAMLVVADNAYAVIAANYSAGPIDLLWLASYILWGAAALHPSMRTLSEPSTQRSAPFTNWRLAALTIAVLIAPVALAVELIVEVHLDAWPVAICSILLFLLVMGRMRITVSDIVVSTRKRDELQDELVHQAAHDSLTELPNRAHVIGLLEAALHRGQRSGSLVGLLFVDLDGFKAVNDAHGHRAGDQVLRQTAQRMREQVRRGDTVGRLGGDEFVVLMEPLPDVEAIIDLARRIIATISLPMRIAGGAVSIGASVGVALNSDGSTDAHQLLHHADVAAYRAKSAGRGRMEIFDDALRREIEDRASLEAAITAGLDDGEFELYYQPVVTLDTGAVRGYEALIRWQRPGHGLVAPDSFIPTAEQSNLIIEIDRWVLDCATRQLVEWTRSDPDRYQDVTVAVNISGRHLGSPAVITNVAAALRDSTLPANRLVLEITETVLVDEPTATSHLRALRDLGVGISIDDFGTGYTSIGQLQHLHVDTLKIDRSFIASNAPGARELVALMISAAHAFGLQVVAEGVELPEQVGPLIDGACDSAQGYLFGRPEAVPVLPVVGTVP